MLLRRWVGNESDPKTSFSNYGYTNPGWVVLGLYTRQRGMLTGMCSHIQFGPSARVQLAYSARTLILFVFNAWRAG